MSVCLFGLKKTKLKYKKTVLILTDWYQPAFKAGGPITSIVNACELLKDDYNFYILTSNKDLDQESLVVKVNKWVEGKNGEFVYYLEKSLTKKLLISVIDNLKPEIIWLNSMFSLNFTIRPLLILPKSINAKIFLSPRGMLHKQAFSQKGLKKKFFLKLLALSSNFKKAVLVASNEEEKNQITFHGLKNGLIVLPNIPKISLLKTDRDKAPKKVITIISRIAPEKNALFAVNVLSKLDQKCKVNWIGEGKDMVYIDRFRTQTKQLPSHIEFYEMGAQKEDIIKEVLEQTKVFYLPTLGENFGHAIYEALATGTPAVIGTNTPFKEITQSNAGFAVDATDTHKNQQAITTILNSSDEGWHIYSKNAKEFCSLVFVKEDAKSAYINNW